MAEAETPPGPETAEALPEAVRSEPLLAFRHLAEGYGDLVRWPSLFGPSYLFNAPSLVRAFFQDPVFVRTPLLKTVLGEGSLASDGPGWRRRRRIVQPGFERARIVSFAAAMLEETERLARSWEGASEPVSINAAMMRLTLRIVARSLFSAAVEAHEDVIDGAVTDLVEGLGALTPSLFSGPATMSPARNRRMRAARAALDGVVDELLADRRRLPPERWPQDLLTVLLEAEDPETGARLDDAQLRDEVVTMLVAGHETTAALAAWTWLRLDRHPEVERRWHRDIDRRFPEGRPSAAALGAEEHYTQLLVQEVLRLHPPVWSIARALSAAHEVEGFRLERGAPAFICPYLLHRHPDHWDDPEAFTPARFAAGAPRKIDRYAFVPFGRGPHMCTGHHFATLEAQLILVALGRRFRLRLIEGEQVRAAPWVTLRVAGELPMRVEPRS